MLLAQQAPTDFQVMGFIVVVVGLGLLPVELTPSVAGVWSRGRMSVMPKKFPLEFKRDVVTVARRGELSVAEVAVAFGVPEESVRRGMKQADVDDGIRDGQTTTEQAEVVQLRRDRRRLDGERDPAPRPTSLRARSQHDVPAGR